MRLLKLACSLALAIACLIGLSTILTAHAAPVSGSIQAAINIVQDGATIFITPGIYTESLTINKSLTLTGVSSATTIIQAVSNQRVITVTSGHDLRLENLAVVGGRAGSGSGGGILIDNGRLQLAGVLIADNRASYGGGVFQGGTGRVDAVNSRIERNQSGNHGGGLYVAGDAALTNTLVLSNIATWDGGGLIVWNGRADLAGGRFEGNQSGRNGGGLDVNNSLNLSGTAFITNTAKRDGGGVLQWNNNQFITVTNAHFERNLAKRNGGGLNIAQGATTTLTGTLFLTNTAHSFTTTNTAGGGLFFDGPGLLQIDTSTFRANLAYCTGCLAPKGGGAWISATLAAVIQDSVFERNQSWHGGGLNSSTAVNIRRANFRENTAGYGAGAVLYGGGFVQGSDFLRNSVFNRGGGLRVIGGNLQIAETRFISNTSGVYTGGLDFTNATARLTNTVIAYNHVITGAGLHIENSTVHALHTTIASNTADSLQSSGVVATGSPGLSHSKVWLTNTLLISHTVGISVSSLSTATLNGTLWFGNQADYYGGVSTSNDTHGDPLVAADGYHLTAASQQAIGRGVNSGVPIDLDGDPRPIGLADLGADEYVTFVYLPLTLR